MATAVRRAASAHPGLAVRGEVLSGGPAATLLARAVDTCLLVVGASQPVLEFGFAEAALRGVPLVAEYVWSQPADTIPTRLGPDGVDDAQARCEAERMLAEALVV